MTDTPSCSECGFPIAAVHATIDAQLVDLRFTAACGHELPRERGALLWSRYGYRWDVPVITGARLIDAERARQQTQEGYTLDGDQRRGDGLAWAAWAHIDRALNDNGTDLAEPPAMWPWGQEAWNFHASPLRRLVIAGALIAAEIDRRLTEQRRPKETP